MSAPARLRIDLWSDVMCPWCVIGYHQLLRALDELAGEIEVEVRWQPFELNPAMPPEGEDMIAHIARKYGRTIDAARTDEVARIAREAGYAMPLAAEASRDRRLWNTFAAHCLLAWALRDHGAAAQTRLALALFDAHFRDGRNVSDRDELLDIARVAGFAGPSPANALDDPEIARMVRDAERSGEQAGITGIPTMVIAGGMLIPGMQEPATYAALLRRAAERQVAAG